MTVEDAVTVVSVMESSMQVRLVQALPLLQCLIEGIQFIVEIYASSLCLFGEDSWTRGK